MTDLEKSLQDCKYKTAWVAREAEGKAPRPVMQNLNLYWQGRRDGFYKVIYDADVRYPFISSTWNQYNIFEYINIFAHLINKTFLCLQLCYI